MLGIICEQRELFTFGASNFNIMRSLITSHVPARAFTVLLAICMADVASATPDRMRSFHALLPTRATSRIEDLKCMTCHFVRPPRFNDFGRAVHDELDKEHQRLLSDQTLAALAKLDSDKDGYPNEAEWKADTYAGDAADHPNDAATPGTAAPDANSAKEEDDNEHEGKEKEGGFPDHAFHPALVHFPIALFIFGALMDIVGWRKSSASMRDAAGPCLLWGALSCLIIVPTGLAAFFIQKLPWAGAPLTHFICAVSAIVLMIATVLMRRSGKKDQTAYFVLLALAAIAVGVAGHFGSALVFNG